MVCVEVMLVQGEDCEAPAPVQEVLQAVYAHPALSLESCTELEAVDARRVNQISGGQKAMTYGEMQPGSWSRLLADLHVGGDDTVYDLGSGRGRLVVQAALETGCRRAVGVELSKQRHQQAARAAKRLSRYAEKMAHARAAHAAEAVKFINGDMRQVELADATVVYLMNQDLPRKLNEQIWEVLVAESERRRSGDSPSATRRLVLLTLLGIRGAGEPSHILPSSQSWTDAVVNVNLYDLFTPPVPPDLELGPQGQDATVPSSEGAR
uniref:Histone-lysine N-methyltransferase, H3 lysine-79 specific n=1 Tax=Rhizochromulina marina TaxID=1034831 RepID=A0A7S2R563_9STRA